MGFFDLAGLNYWTILIAVVVNQVIGAAWYGLLAKPWMAETGLKAKDLQANKGTPAYWRPYVLAVICGLIFSLGLALIIQGLGVETAAGGLFVGFLAAVAFVVTSHAVNYSFEGRSFKLLLINSGYPLISYSLIGAILAF